MSEVRLLDIGEFEQDEAHPGQGEATASLGDRQGGSSACG
jgi:hypothetical protein